eukprot:snap_masked-scaffold52_size450388-processed-gene-0.7 protein:Tk02864 transcript:snap_masked-scaffold52_size450388-processed-gene-0.7-mRNA-1 annotation:"hypothetical protein DAPPUDRAFT_116586"
MANEIMQSLDDCEECHKFRPSQQRETLGPHPRPGRPFEAVSTDLFEYGGHTFMIGTAIKIQDPQTKVWDRNGIITEVRKGHFKRSYVIKTRGRFLVRNRRMIRPIRQDKDEEADRQTNRTILYYCQGQNKTADKGAHKISHNRKSIVNQLKSRKVN